MLGWTIFTCVLFALAGGLTTTVFFRQGEILKRQKLHTDELRDMYGRGFTALQIAKAMGRTLKSVYGQTYRLGLSREQAEARRRKR